jgi:hypothetical protein
MSAQTPAEMMEQLAAASETAIDEAFTDALIGGAGFLMVRADGSIERLDPAAVQVQSPIPLSDADAFLARILAAAQAGERVSAEDVAKLRKLADWAEAAPAPGWNGTLDRHEAARAVAAAKERLAMRGAAEIAP